MTMSWSWLISYGTVTCPPMTHAGTRRMSAQARREQLLDAAKDVVADHGFHGVSIEAVARGAGVTRPIVYRHFRDLGALLDALVERETLRALMQLREVLPAGVDDLIAAFEGYLRAVRSDPVTWRLVLVTPEGAPALLRERIAAGRAQVVAQLAAAVDTRAGSPDPELTAHALSAVADEAARLMLADPDRYPPERLIAQARWLLTR
jgi:AcrR family transcriptional regulator